MAAFEGSLYVVGDDVDPVRGQVLLEGADVVMSAAGQAIGAWPAANLDLTRRSDGIHMNAEGEELVFLADDEPGFAAALGLPTADPTERSSGASRRATRALERDQRREDAKATKKRESAAATEEKTSGRRSGKGIDDQSSAGPTATWRFGFGRSRDPAIVATEENDEKPSYRETLRLAQRKRRLQLIIGAAAVLGGLAIFVPTVVAMAFVVLGGVGILAAVAGMIEPLIAAKLPSRWQPTRLLIVSTLVLLVGALVAAIAG